MHRVGSAGSNGGSVRTRKEKKLTYVLNDANDTKVSFFTPIWFIAIRSCVTLCLIYFLVPSYYTLRHDLK